MTEIGPLLGAGKEAEAYAYGEHVLKLYHRDDQRSTAFAEAATLSIVADHGLPSPLVFEAGRYSGRWGLVMSRAPGQPLAELALSDPAAAPAALQAMVALHLRVHAETERRLLPLKHRLAARLRAAPHLDEVLRHSLIERLAALPDGNRLCHGDFHPFNLIGTPAHPMIVDWPDATSGPPAADTCRSYLLLRHGAPQFAEPYLDAYSRASGIPRAAILAWLPILAAARLCENVPEENARLLDLATS